MRIFLICYLEHICMKISNIMCGVVDFFRTVMSVPAHILSDATANTNITLPYLIIHNFCISHAYDITAGTTLNYSTGSWDELSSMVQAAVSVTVNDTPHRAYMQHICINEI